METQRKLSNNYSNLIILFIGGALIYILPYLKNYYYDSFKLATNLNDDQMGSLGMFYGMAAFVSYFLGGFLADKFSARKLLSVSFFVTSIGGFYMATFPNYQSLCLIHAVWGITTILTFWPPLIKAIRMLGNENEQGKAFGFFDGGRGIVNSLVMTAAVLIINKYGWTNNNLKYMILFYYFSRLIIGVLLFLCLKDNPLEKSDEKFSLNSFIHVVKMPHTWLIIIIVFCSYSTNIVSYYITPFSINILGQAALVGTILTIAAQYLRPFSAPMAGFLGDKMNSSKTVCFGFLLMAFSHFLVIIIPSNGTMVTALIISICLCMYVSMYGIQALHYALMEETEYPLKYSGVAVGVIATLGYLPETVIPKISGLILNHFTNNFHGEIKEVFPSIASPEISSFLSKQINLDSVVNFINNLGIIIKPTYLKHLTPGYKYVFSVTLGLALIGFLTTLYWMHITKEKRAYLLSIKKKV